ncbi:DNA helicase [Hafnia phage yong3]|nr:DNA helicase [Hafnia phage yong3]
MKPRDYQREAVYSIFRYFDEEKGDAGNPLIALPTGTGKSIVIAYFLKLLYEWYPNQRVMMLTHVKELIAQNYDKIMQVWPEAPAGVYSAGLKRKDAYSMITFAGIQSVGKKADLFGKIDLILVDEAHLISPTETTLYKKFFADIREKNPYLKVIGLTATPYRLGYGSIVKIDDEDESALFDKITFDATTVEAFNWFLDEGYLLPVVPKRTTMQIDVSGVGKRGGEFIAKELQSAATKDDATIRALEEAMELGEDRQSWLVFCSGVEHAIDAASMLNDMGVPCGCVHSKLKPHERDEEILKFKRGEYRALTNNNVLTTGFDHPALDMIIMLRPTASTGLWVQMLGRGTRPCYAEGFDLSTTTGRLDAIAASHKQNCLVLDFSGNTRRLGPINDPVLPKRPGEKGGGTAPIKECKHCNMENHASARFCGGIKPIPYHEADQLEMSRKGMVLKGDHYVKRDYCGAEFKFETKLKKAASTQDLIKNTLPVITDYRVDHVVYMKHTKRNDSESPPSLKVTYYCGTKTFSEWVSLMRTDWAGRKAAKWWRERTHYPLPASIDDALEIASGLKTPTHIKVWTNKKFPEIMNHCYDGTCFGTEAKPEKVEPRPIQVYSGNAILQAAGATIDDDVSYEDIVAQNTVGIAVSDVRATFDPTEHDADYVPF